MSSRQKDQSKRQHNHLLSCTSRRTRFQSARTNLTWYCSVLCSSSFQEWDPVSGGDHPALSEGPHQVVLHWCLSHDRSEVCSPPGALHWVSLFAEASRHVLAFQVVLKDWIVRLIFLSSVVLLCLMLGKLSMKLSLFRSYSSCPPESPDPPASVFLPVQRSGSQSTAAKMAGKRTLTVCMV